MFISFYALVGGVGEIKSPDLPGFYFETSRGGRGIVETNKVKEVQVGTLEFSKFVILGQA